MNDDDAATIAGGIFPPKRNNSGRPPLDWDSLFMEWSISGLDRVTFLLSKGIDLKHNGAARKTTSDWERRAASKLADQLADQLTDQIVKAKVVAPPTFLPMSEGTTKEDLVTAGQTPAPVESSWQMIQRWRGNQSIQDWRICDQIRMHVSLLLRGGLRKMPGKDWDSTLKASEVRLLALAVRDVQHIQRLALGLSTENIGIDAQVETVTADTSDSKQRNVFVVELSNSGKFTRARPRQIS